MKKIFDNLNRDVVITNEPQRIISLCPSITETIIELGQKNKLVGRTKFCISPPTAKSITSVGGTKQVDYDLIDNLKPDLIFAVKEENTAEIVNTLEKKYPVFVWDINTVNDAWKMIAQLGEIMDCEMTAQAKLSQIQMEWQPLKLLFKGKKVLYFIWQNPLMTASKDTYIDEVLQFLGFENLAYSVGNRYPAISESNLSDFQPDYVFLSSEPYPFKEKHKIAFKGLFPSAEIVLVSGEMFSWYGTRMLTAASYFQSFLGS